jgi:hypothetical protein
MPAHRTGTFGAAIVALAALLMACLTAGCRVGGMGTVKLDDRLRPVAAEANFTDLAGDPAEPVIKGLAKLGVLDHTEGYFGPDQVIGRGAFITWLVRANDIFFRDQPRRQIPLASSNGLPVFSDVTASVPCFPYVQGMVDRGYPVGWGPQELGYDHDLTREYMIFLRDGVDLGASAVVKDPAEYNPIRIRLRTFLKDADLVSDPYLAAVLADVTQGRSIRLAFGKAESLNPKRPLTRREAALAVSEIRGRTWQQALKIEPQWKPLPPQAQKAVEEEAQKEGEEHGGGH